PEPIYLSQEVSAFRGFARRAGIAVEPNRLLEVGRRGVPVAGGPLRGREMKSRFRPGLCLAGRNAGQGKAIEGDRRIEGKHALCSRRGGKASAGGTLLLWPDKATRPVMGELLEAQWSFVRHSAQGSMDLARQARRQCAINALAHHRVDEIGGAALRVHNFEDVAACALV